MAIENNGPLFVFNLHDGGGVTWFNAIIEFICNSHFLDYDWLVHNNGQLIAFSVRQII